MEYTVRWEIELDADSPFQAAQKAMEMQRDENSLATSFDVSSEGCIGEVTIRLEVSGALSCRDEILDKMWRIRDNETE